MEQELHDEIRGVVTDVLDKGGATWTAFAEAGLLSLSMPEDLDGAGLGAQAQRVLLAEAGARCVDVPIWSTLTAGALPLASQGLADLMAAVSAGSHFLVPALSEPQHALPSQPTASVRDGKVSGTKTGVVLAGIEGSFTYVVSVSGPEGPMIALVDADAPGVEQRPIVTSSGWSEVVVEFRDTPISALVDAAPAVRSAAIAGLVAWGAGLLKGAQDLTAGYITERKQFGRSLAQFQAVQMQMADVFVTSRLVDLTARHLARGIDAGLDLRDDLAVAAYWFAAHAPQALQTCHHLHGGMGVDETYPLAGYFSRVKDIVRLLGGVSATLAAVPATEMGAKNAELTAAQREFKAQVRTYFEGLVSHEARAEMLTDRHGEAYHRIIRQMGEDGWMGVGWPTEYGGKGLGGIEQQIFANEASRNDVHLPAVTLQTVGPTLQAYGTQEQKDLFLRRILEGDVHFAIGYSEADAGTDLASIRTSARRDANGDWIVNGQKMWTTGGHAADYIWLAARTDPDAPKHQGISVFILDTKDPGFSWTPIITCDGSHHVNATYYNDVRVPASMLVGEENKGWQLITTQLNHERVMLGPSGRIEGLRDMVAQWLGEELPSDARDTLAKATAAMRVNELLNWEVASGTQTGKAAVADASASKVFSSEVIQRLGLALEEVVTRHGDLSEPETATLAEYLDKTSKRNLVLTFGGGVNEVQRELICMFGLGLPRVPR